MGRLCEWLSISFLLHPPSVAHNKSLNPFPGQIALFPCVGWADWKHVCHSALPQANQETPGCRDFCTSSAEPASKTSSTAASGLALELPVISADRWKILLATSLSTGFNEDLNLKCDTPHRPPRSGPTEPNPLFCSNTLRHIMEEILIGFSTSLFQACC